MKFNLVEKIKANKKIQYVLIAVCLLIVLIILICSFKKSSNETEKISSVNEYVTNLEQRLEQTLSKVEGAGRVSVVITIESGMETVLATEKVVVETSNGLQTTEKPIIINGKTVVLKENYPKITGVLIVADGADKIAVMTKIQQATVSLFDINVNQIEILKMD